MDAPYWTKKFEVSSISRLVLRDAGLTAEQINMLSDLDMETIANQLNLSASIGLYENIRTIVGLYLAERNEKRT